MVLLANNNITLPKKFIKLLGNENIQFIAYSKKDIQEQRNKLRTTGVVYLIFAFLTALILAWPFFSNKPLIYTESSTFFTLMIIVRVIMLFTTK